MIKKCNIQNIIEACGRELRANVNFQKLNESQVIAFNYSLHLLFQGFALINHCWPFGDLTTLSFHPNIP